MPESQLRITVCWESYTPCFANYIFYTQQLEDAREPVEDPLLLDGTPRPLESDPLLGEHLHLARLLQPQDAPAQLLSVGGACNFSSDNLLHKVSQH